MYLSNRIIPLAICVALVACRPDPGGQPEYDVPPDEPEWVEGPVPCEEGQKRFSVGIYFDGCPDAGEVTKLQVNNIEAAYWIYDRNDATYTSANDTEDVHEGKRSHKIIHAGLSWWGGGVHLVNGSTVSLLDYDHLYVSLKSSDDAFADVQLKFAYDDDYDDEDDGDAVSVQAGSYGYTNDGEWHDLKIPIDDYSGDEVDFGALNVPFSMTGAGGEEGAILYIDNLFYM